MRRVFVLSAVAFAASCIATAQIQNAEVNEPQVFVLRDLVQEFGPDLVSNASVFNVGQRERSGGIEKPAIFIHTEGAGPDPVLRWNFIDVPSAGQTQHEIDGKPTRRWQYFLVFDIGLRDGIPWGDDAQKANGVRYFAAINKDLVFEEDIVESGWKSRAIDLTPWAGQRIDAEFRVNAIDGNTNYDWSMIGEPLIVKLRAPGDYTALAPDQAGLAIARIESSQPGEIGLRLGNRESQATIGIGTTWIPIRYDSIAPIEVVSTVADARLSDVIAAPFPAEIIFEPMETSSPLLSIAAPFDVIQNVHNIGRGHTWAAEQVDLKITRIHTGEPVQATATLKKIPPRSRTGVRWSSLVLEEPGDYIISSGEQHSRVHIFPYSLGAPQSRPSATETKAFPGTPGGGAEGWITTPWASINIASDRSPTAFGTCCVWEGTQFSRVASIYPVARLIVPSNGLESGRELRLRIGSIEADGVALKVKAYAEEHPGEPTVPYWDVSLRITPDESGVRFHTVCTATPSEDSELLAFYGPALLAGDRSFGAEKQFALFPGLEYLEGNEGSSSERDLAPPLHDRRVPAIHKVAAPIMAVQGDNSLVALLWDAKQQWRDGDLFPAARFLSPTRESGLISTSMTLFAPSVGDHVIENTFQAKLPITVRAGESLVLKSTIVLDTAARHSPDSVVHGPHRGGLVLTSFQHWFDVFGVPKPSPPPRTWEQERALSRDAYFNAVWSDDPLGWRHCQGWAPGLHAGHSVPLIAEEHAGVDTAAIQEIDWRKTAVLNGIVAQGDDNQLWNGTACHIVQGELPFHVGYLPEALSGYRDAGYARLNARENGLWVWRPGAEQYASLGVAGDHTLGQAALPSFVALRAARMSGDRELARQALDAMKQMEKYDVPRGAQTWECPLYQPDILAAAHAIRAYCEAYRITGDPAHLAHARYWAMTGLPFLYLWDMDGYPTMRYNVISVIGSTFYTHSWLGLPVVWCGLVYAYALQEFAQYDASMPWLTFAEGITNSAMWQQYADGTSKGCYPDSWNMIDNKPNPADINPENILMNGHRLHGNSPEIRSMRFDTPQGVVLVNSMAEIADASGTPGNSAFRMSLRGPKSFSGYTTIAPVPLPRTLKDAGDKAENCQSLNSMSAGWCYDDALQAIIVKSTWGESPASLIVEW